MRLILTALSFVVAISATHAISIFDTFNEKLTYEAGKPLITEPSDDLRALKYTNLLVGGTDLLVKILASYFKSFKDEPMPIRYLTRGCDFINILIGIGQTYGNHALITSLTTGRMPKAAFACLPSSSPFIFYLAPWINYLLKGNYLKSTDSLIRSALIPDIANTGTNAFLVNSIQNKFTDRSSASFLELLAKNLVTTARLYIFIRSLFTYKSQKEPPSLTQDIANYSNYITNILNMFIKYRVHSIATAAVIKEKNSHQLG